MLRYLVFLAPVGPAQAARAASGLRRRGAWGEIDELSKKIVAHSFSVSDSFATICAAAGVHSTASLYERRPTCSDHRSGDADQGAV